jgi:spermidine synthase
MKDKSRRYLYFTVFAAGMTALAVEISAARLLGNVFGTSNLVWASIIGLILIYLTIGYFIGGRWADRSPYPRTMYTILIWGAFLVGLIPVPSTPVLRLAADAFDQLQLGILLGAFTGILILFSIPVTLLGTSSPFAIRLAIQTPMEAGTVSGRIYAISTLGSFVGSFLPVLVLIPTIGTARTFLLFSIFLTLVALVGLWHYEGSKAALPWVWMPIVLIIIGLLGTGKGVKATAGQIYETESAYNYIQVLEVDGYRYLRLNEGMGVHSAYHPDQLVYYGPWMQFLAGPFFNQPPYGPVQVDSMAVVGLAAGTVARQATEVFGPIPIDGYEIDPTIIEVGKEFFNMNAPNLNTIPQDGRLGLEHSPRRYSLIVVDAYRPPYIPWHLTTYEFFQIVRDHLKEDGVLAINVGRAPEDQQLLEGLVGTIGTIFPSVYVMDVPGTFNSIVYATVQPTTLENLYGNIVYLRERSDVHTLLTDSLMQTAANIRSTPESETVFTDDLAPIEWITNNMVLYYILFGDLEVVQ